MNIEHPLVLLSAIALLILAFALQRHRQRMRTRYLSDKARSLALQFSPLGTHDIVDRFKPFMLANDCLTPDIGNSIYGNLDGMMIALFDYRYDHYDDPSTFYKVLMVHSMVFSFPHFHVRPRRLLHKLTKALGARQVEFEMHSEFLARWVVGGDDEDRIRQVMSKRVVDFFNRQADVEVEFREGGFIYYAKGHVAQNDVCSIISAGMELCWLLNNGLSYSLAGSD